MRWLSGNVSAPTADGSPRTTKNPHSPNWKVMRKEFYATKEPALGAIEGKRYLKGTKTMLIEPLPVKEVRNAVEGRPVQRRRVVKQGLRAELSVGSVPTVGLLPQLSVRRK